MKKVFILIAGCALAISAGYAQQSKTIKIAVTTDVHGAYFPNDWYTGEQLQGSLAQVYSWASGERMKKNHEVILMDNGDLIQGDPASYFSNFMVPDKPNIAARILNFMEYSAGTVGNHDLEAGHAVYDKLVKEFKHPWLAANAVKVTDQMPYFRPYAILRKSGLTIAVMGIITPKVPDWLPYQLWSGMEFKDMIGSAKFWMEKICTLEKPDLIVGLFHAGVDPTYGQQNPNQPLNENASRLVAEQVDGFDVIFTGHDHRHWNLKVPSPAGDSVLILGSGSRAEEIAVATLTLPAGKKNFKLSGDHVRVAEYAPDPKFMLKFAGYIDSVQRYVDEPVGTITQTVSTEESFFGPSAFTDLIHRAQLEITGADISFTAPLSFKATLPAGTLYVKDLFKLYRFENQLYVINLTGREILGYLNYSYSLWMKQMSGPGDLMLNMTRQADGSWRLRNASYNFDSAMGIDYQVDLSKPAGSMVDIIRFSDGKPFDPEATYKVALNSYRASGGGNHLLLGAKLSKKDMEVRMVKEGETDFRFLLSKWIREKGMIEPKAGNNWKVVPQEWISEASPRDRDRLFRSGS
jgi:2',3'-cyclic-nucleotide 2'-phosphodiesterase/3'-nucleotidase